MKKNELLNDVKLLPFSNIYDLLKKVDKIKEAHVINNNRLKTKLTENGISFQDIDDYGIIAEEREGLISSVAKIMKEHDCSEIQYVYKKLKITKF